MFLDRHIGEGLCRPFPDHIPSAIRCYAIAPHGSLTPASSKNLSPT